MLRRRAAILVKCFLAVCLLVFLALLCERFRGQIALSRFRSSLLARGEKLSAQDFTLPVPEVENGAQAFTNAAGAIVPGSLVSLYSPPRMRLMESGRALVGWQEEEWKHDKKAYHWQDLEPEVRTNALLLGRIREALAQPQIHHRLDYVKGMQLHLPHLVQAKSLSSFYGAAAQLALRQGRGREVREALDTLSRLARVMDHDHLVISELVRIALARISRVSIWEALQSDLLTPEDLLILQRTWDGLHFLENMEKGLEGERIYGDASMELIGASHEKTQDAFSAIGNLMRGFAGVEMESSSWKKPLEDLPYGPEIAEAIERQIYARVWRFAWAHQLRLRNLREMQQLIEITRAALISKSFAAVRPDILAMERDVQEAGLYDRLRSPFDTPFVQVSKSVQKAMEAETERSLVLCALAIKRYSLERGRLPGNLAELVPEYLSSVPVDYMDGKPMRYRVQADGSYVLYSVGSDTVDQGGDPSRLSDQSQSANPWSRKDLVWPAPARPEEVQAWRKKSE